MSEVRTAARVAARWRATEQRLDESMRRLARTLRERARLESRRRRRAWAGLAALMVLVPMLFNLARESQFSATVEIFPRAVAPYPPVSDPAYYRSFLDDARLQKGMALNVEAPAEEYRGASVRRPSRGPLSLTVRSNRPIRAQQVVNALAGQIAVATQRQLANQVTGELLRLDIRLSAPPPTAAERRDIRSRIRTLRRLAAGPPPNRVVLGAPAPVPPLSHVADKVADALPGDFPTRKSPLSAGLAGLLIVATLWAIALLLVPPGAAGAAVAAERSPGRLSRVLSRVPSIRLPRGVPAAILALAGVAVVAIVMDAGRDLSTFRLDEWSFVLGRQDDSLDDFLRPHNGDLALVPVVIFKLLLATVGMDPYWPYRLVLVLVTVLIGALVYLYARPRLGRGWALAPAILCMLVGQAGHDLIWPFQIGVDISIACGVGMLLCFDRPGRRSDFVASALLFLAVCSSMVGIAAAAVAAVEVLTSPGQRRERALRILAFPIVAYGAWWLHYQPPGQDGSGSAVEGLRLFADLSGAATTSLFGIAVSARRVLVVALLGAVAVGLVMRRNDRRALILACAAPVAYWVLLIVEHGSTGAQLLDSRYILPGSVFVACVLCELLRGSTARARPWMALPLAIAVVLAMVNNVGYVRDTADFDAQIRSAPLRAKLAALSVAGQGRPVFPGYAPTAREAPTIAAGPYFDATARFGDPAPDPDPVIRGSTAAIRSAADRTYFGATLLRPVPVGAPRSTSVSGCFTTSDESRTEVVIPRRGLVLRAPGTSVVPVTLRRWGDVSSSVPAGDVGPGWAAIRPSRDTAKTPLRVQIGYPGVRVCRIGR